MFGHYLALLGRVCVFRYEVLKDALLAKEKVEGQLQKFYKFTTDYTIIRPGGLITAPATGKAELTVTFVVKGRDRKTKRFCTLCFRFLAPISLSLAFLLILV